MDGERVSIRIATQADLPAIQHLQVKLGEAELPFDQNIDMPGISTSHKSGYIGYVNIDKKLQDKESNYVVVAVTSEENPKVVGVSYGMIQTDTDWSIHEQFGYVGCVFIDVDFRGMGIWPRLLEALEIWFREKQIKQIRLECYCDNLAAVKAYTKSQFRPMQYVMHKDL